MIEKGYNNSRSFHLAGIIPLAGESSNINLLLPNYLLPLSENYTALENAVTQCAYAGCETIWIVCNDDVAPAIKHVLGDYVEDPVWRNRGMDRFPSESRRQIPIFYVPIHPKDRDRRDSRRDSSRDKKKARSKSRIQCAEILISPKVFFVGFSGFFFLKC